MTTTILLQIITGLGAVITFLLKGYLSEETTKERKQDAIRQAVVDGDSNTVSNVVKRLLR